MAVQITQFLESLKTAEAKRRAAAVVAIEQFANHVLGEAQALAPVDTGFLKASGYVAPVGDPGEGGGPLSFTIGFNAHYALIVHERLDVHHPQGQAKFLETAMRVNAPKLVNFVQAAIDRVT
jgi:hypothetical protein